MSVIRGEMRKGSKSELDVWLDKIQFLSDSMESTSQPFGVGHSDGSLLICNNAFCLLTGYGKEELLSNVNWSADLTPPEWREHEAGVLRELQRTGKPQRYEKEYIRKDGTRVPVELLVHTARDTAGNTLFYYSFVTNIAERKGAEEALRESETNLARSQAIAHLGNWELDTSTGRVRGSEELYRMFNLRPDMTLDAYVEKMHPDDRARVVESINAAINEGKPYNIDYRIVPRPGDTRHIHAEGEVTRDKNGLVVKLFGTALDITERKRAEEALRESEAMLARSQEMAHIGSWVWDVETGEINRSAESYRIFGLEPGECMITFEKFLSFIIPEDRGRAASEIRSFTENGMPYNIMYRIRRKNGATRILQSWGEPVKDASGRVVRMFGTNQDITERKQVEDELRNAHDELEMRVLERTRELEKANTDLKGQVRERLHSEKALKISEEGLQQANRALKMLSRCIEAMIRSEDEAMLLEDVCHIIVSEGGYRLAWIGYIEDDEMRTVRPVARAGYDEGYVDNLKIALNDPVRGSGPTGISLRTGKPYGSRNVDADAAMQPWRQEALRRGYLSTLNLPVICENQILGTLVIYSGRQGAFEDEELGLLADLAENLAYGVKAIRDRERRDRAEKELQQSRDELENRVRERTEELRQAKARAELYVDLLSHDINNLNQIAMGYLEIAKEMLDLKDEERDFIEKPYESLRRSSVLIDNVRKLQKITEGDMKDEIIELGQLLSDISSEYETPCIGVDKSQECKGPCYVKANQLLHDVFSNLLSNAIKHADHCNGRISIILEAVADDDRPAYTISVEDNGPGIPDDMKGKVFNRLQRGETRAKGIGLGLYLVKSLVESYHGRVWVEDRVAGDHTKGARFVVMLPAYDK